MTGRSDGVVRDPSRELPGESARQGAVDGNRPALSDLGAHRWGLHRQCRRHRSPTSDPCAELVDDIDPVLVSGHLAWSTHQGAYLNDLLPLPYDDETLQLVSTHLHQVQDALRRPYLVENPSSYVGFGQSTMTEVEFLAELVQRTSCRLLCDVSNVFLSGHNMGFDPYLYIDAFPAQAIGEVHLGGFAPEADEATPGAEILIDTHGTVIAEPVWQLYAHALRRFGATPTLIEWDNDIPPLATLLAEAERGNAAADAALRKGPHALTG